MKKFAFLACTVVLAGTGCFGSGEATEDTSATGSIVDRASILVEARENGLIMDELEILAMRAAVLEQDPQGRSPEDVVGYLETNVKDWWSAALADVTGGDGYGIAHTTFQGGTFTVLAEMGNLPEPASEYFYEAWLVRRDGELAVLSLGPAQRIEDDYVVVYLTSTDFSDHDFFILTLESDDGNPAPGEHILEGNIK